MTELQKQLMDCDHCGGTGVDGDVDDRGLTIDAQYVEIHQWRRVDHPNQSGWFDDSKERAYYSDPARIEGRTVYVKKEN